MVEKYEPPTSRNIPLPIQREVRQRCGFGCVICGLPLYEYEHLLGWANVRRHVASEITLLCDQHHREKTGGLLPVDRVIKADRVPYNLQAGVSKPFDLHYAGDSCEAVIGGNSFTTEDAGYGTTMIPLSIDDVPMLGFVLTDGHLLLNINLFDENNELILRIANNQLVYSVNPWDIQLVGRRLQIREGRGNFLIEMTFEVPNRIVISRGRFLRNGVEIVIAPTYALVTNNSTLISQCSQINCAFGIVIGPHASEAEAMFRLHGVPRYDAARREKAIAWARDKVSRK